MAAHCPWDRYRWLQGPATTEIDSLRLRGWPYLSQSGQPTKIQLERGDRDPWALGHPRRSWFFAGHSTSSPVDLPQPPESIAESPTPIPTVLDHKPHEATHEHSHQRSAVPQQRSPAALRIGDDPGQPYSDPTTNRHQRHHNPHSMSHGRSLRGGG